jgi:hypothetical protein
MAAVSVAVIVTPSDTIILPIIAIPMAKSF